MTAVGPGTAGRIALLLSLYFAQGLPFGLFTQALPVFMRQSGQSLEAIGLANLLALPWALKFLWASAVDRVPGPRRRVILPLNLVAVALLGALSTVEPRAIVPLLVTVLLCNLAAATQDIATDGYAVELLDKDERGIGNGVQVAGYRLGMVVGGGVIVAVFDRLGWSLAFVVAGLCVAAASLPLVLAPAASRIAAERPRFRDAMLHRWFAEPGAGRWFWLLILYKFGDAFGTAMVKPLLVDQGRSLAWIGTTLGVAGSAAGMIGAVVGGLLVNRLGRRTALAAFGSAQVATLALYVAVAASAPDLARAAVVVEHLCSGMATAALFTAMMDAARPDRAGVDYTVQASVQVIGSGIAAALSGWSAARLGYAGHFAVATVLCTLPVALVLSWPRDAPQRFRL